MERKSMGAFIAALRKANGMTQKELAEKLNVSDKSISRWERDDGAPDLSLIPVIAEIFGVTCDELLRGERKSANERETAEAEPVSNPRSEKQRQRLLAVSLSRYKTRSFIAIGIAIVGLIAALACNFAFYRAYIGFMIAAVFYLAAMICQVAFVNSAYLSVADDDLAGPEVDRFKCTVVRLAEVAICLTVVLLAFSLPLVLLARDAYVGLQADSWFLQGAVLGVIALGICCAACGYLNGSLLKKGAYPLSEKEEQVWRHNRKLKHRCVFGVAIALAVTFGVHMVVTNIWTAANLSEKIIFHDVDRFVEFMEQDITYRYSVEYYSSVGTEVLPPESQVGETIYYDEYGNEISEEEAMTRELMDGDGNVVCEYIQRNETVATVRYSDDENGAMRIEVITQDAWRAGRAKSDVISTSFCVLYFVEIAAAFLVYFKKRTKA